MRVLTGYSLPNCSTLNTHILTARLCSPDIGPECMNISQAFNTLKRVLLVSF